MENGTFRALSDDVEFREWEECNPLGGDLELRNYVTSCEKDFHPQAVDYARQKRASKVVIPKTYGRLHGGGENSPCRTCAVPPSMLSAAGS